MSEDVAEKPEGEKGGIAPLGKLENVPGHEGVRSARIELVFSSDGTVWGNLDMAQ